jgi:hypothetical protein
MQQTFTVEGKIFLPPKVIFASFMTASIAVFLESVSFVKAETAGAYISTTAALAQTIDLNLSGLIQVLSALSSIAVIMGVIFIVVQLRQNAKLIELNAKLTDATFREVKSDISFELLEKLTEESFARRRSFMWEKIKKYQASNWEGYDDSLDDFEIRNFAYRYELFGQMAKEGLVDLETLAKAFEYLVVLDWEAFEPASKHIMERYNLKKNELFSNFQWLAFETERILKQRGSHVPRIMHPEDESR